MSTPAAKAANTALTAAKEKQALYYNRSVKEHQKLPVGQTVRVRFDDKDWRKAELTKQLPFRAYKVKFADGSTRRRTSRHVHFSNEPPFIIDAEDTCDGSATSTPPRSATPGDGPTPRPDASNQQQQHPPAKNTAAAADSQLKTTRSGRVIHKPVRYRQ